MRLSRKDRINEIHQDLHALYGLYMNTHQIAKELRVDDRKVKQIMEGALAVKDGRQIKYRTRIVAQRLADREVIA